jgi:hypothetical protein
MASYGLAQWSFPHPRANAYMDMYYYALHLSNIKAKVNLQQYIIALRIVTLHCTSQAVENCIHAVSLTKPNILPELYENMRAVHVRMYIIEHMTVEQLGRLSLKHNLKHHAIARNALPLRDFTVEMFWKDRYPDVTKYKY